MKPNSDQPTAPNTKLGLKPTAYRILDPAKRGIRSNLTLPAPLAAGPPPKSRWLSAG